MPFHWAAAGEEDDLSGPVKSRGRGGGAFYFNFGDIAGCNQLTS